MIDYFNYSETDLNSHIIYFCIKTSYNNILSDSYFIVHCECNWGAITISAIKQWLYLYN